MTQSVPIYDKDGDTIATFIYETKVRPSTIPDKENEINLDVDVTYDIIEF